MTPNVHLVPRTPEIAKLIEQCARKQISLDECCAAIASLGYKTTSTYAMVLALEWELRDAGDIP